ncbi:MAG: iron-containing alcohol dehydrogenase [Proteobacteria bacterium]|nr:iron-containing alcohol dehydrogenase [Pseudomonadota bacterium]MBT6347713.1 iron-containing alcohol dehydrogenase [Pseudomonadota bacterium]
MNCCHHYQFTPGNEQVFSADVTRIRYGHGVLQELGQEARALGIRRAAVYTDRLVASLPLFQEAVEALRREGIETVIYDEVRVEPTDISFKDAAAFANSSTFDGFVSIGGGSVIDTAKAANLYSTCPGDFMDYVNAPIGQGLAVPGPLRPHLACPTTAGTGSESTGIAVFDLLEMKSKTGISSRAMLPDRGIIDPRWTESLPATVMAATGFDAISHALEALTAKPFTSRPRPESISGRPMPQGANPFSDTLCREALRQAGRYLVRAVSEATDHEARHAMMYAATLAGVGFGNAGCHLPHAMSYPVSGRVQNYFPDGYPEGEAICPHGMSVIVNAPAAYRFTAPGCPERHTEGAQLLGADTGEAEPADAGTVLAQHLEKMMRATGAPNGIGGVGFTEDAVDGLAEAATAQQRLLLVAPVAVKEADLKMLYREALSYW